MTRCPHCAGTTRRIGVRRVCSVCRSWFDASLRPVDPEVPGDVWTVDLRITRPLLLNHREHHIVKAKRVEALRKETAELVAEAQVPGCEHVEVVLVYTPPDRRRRDPLNLVGTLKACQDGIVDAGVVPDDTAEYMTSPMPVIAPVGKRPGRLCLVIRRMSQREVDANRRRNEQLAALIGHPDALITAEQARAALGLTGQETS